MDNNDLLYLSGVDIPFRKAQIVIHQPTIKEIAFIGEETFFSGYELINFSKNLLSEEDKVNLEDKSDFDIFIAILRERNAVMQKNRNCVEMVLALLFPEYQISVDKRGIAFQMKGEQEKHYIDKDNFEDFKLIFNSMFAFIGGHYQSYNPGGALAQKLADKFKKRQQILAQAKPAQKNKKVDILSRYVSILAVGECKDMNSLLNYTIYQLFDEYKRFQLKEGYDIYVKAKMAGAKDLKEVEDWMKDVHSDNDE